MNQAFPPFYFRAGWGILAAALLAAGCSSGSKTSREAGSAPSLSHDGSDGVLPPAPGRDSSARDASRNPAALPGDPSGPGAPPPSPVQPLPPTTPPDAPPDPSPGTLCTGSYQGTFTRHADVASLSISGNSFVLHGNGQDFPGTGTCVDSSPATATFHFALEADPQYEFQGVINVGIDGSVTIAADELKAGRIIDHLKLGAAETEPSGGQ